MFCPFSECSRYLSSQLVRYICKTNKLERALKIKDVLCSALANKLDVMKEEKIPRHMATDMSNSRASAKDCKVGTEDYNGYSTGANESACTREQVRNMQNEGSGDKTVLNGSVIRSSEEQVPKGKFDSVEKELNKAKEELSKVFTEKSQVIE